MSHSHFAEMNLYSGFRETPKGNNSKENFHDIFKVNFKDNINDNMKYNIYVTMF